MTFFKQNFVQLAVFKRVDFSLVAYLERDTHTSLLWPVNSNTGRFVKLANSIISHDRLYLLEHPPSRALLFCNLGHIHVTLHNYTLSIPSVVSQFFPRVTKSGLRDKLQGGAMKNVGFPMDDTFTGGEHFMHFDLHEVATFSTTEGPSQRSSPHSKMASVFPFSTSNLFSSL